MPAKDIYHDTVKTALIKDDWQITDDPLLLSIGGRTVMVDLGAEKLIAAKKGEQKIAVEVKSFIGRSPMTDLEKALGQYILYASILQQDEPDRIIYLAIDTLTHSTLFAEPVGQLLLETTNLKLVVFNAETQEITQWID